ncbi:MAG: hypothetical protein HY923_05155 [Elusimicrobia bacterium]|nr:hypothetical protein [Elusimicrobiota bacterium]
MKRMIPAIAIALSGCVTTSRPPAQASSLEQGMLVARVQTHGALFRKSTKQADLATLVMLDAMGAPIPGLAARSGSAAEGYVVFYDLPPGRYALRSASFPARGVRYRVDAPLDGEFKRSVVLRPGSSAYLGDLAFDTRWPEFADGAIRAGRIILHWLTPWMKRPVLTRDSPLRGYEAGPAEETRALLAVRQSLTGTQWRRLADKRLRELSAAEPVKEEGKLRSKPLALREEPIFSWRDTLKWGEPLRAPEGLAWKRPEGEARIVVFFTTASAKGFKGWDAAVAEMRRTAAGSVEDSSTVYEVQVATRPGLAARATKYIYPDGKLVGSETKVLVTETILVPDGYGLYTARLRATRAEFDAVLPAYREFLLQLVLGPPKPKPPPKQESVLPFTGIP